MPSPACLHGGNSSYEIVTHIKSQYHYTRNIILSSLSFSNDEPIWTSISIHEFIFIHITYNILYLKSQLCINRTMSALASLLSNISFVIVGKWQRVSHNHRTTEAKQIGGRQVDKQDQLMSRAITAFIKKKKKKKKSKRPRYEYIR